MPGKWPQATEAKRCRVLTAGTAVPRIAAQRYPLPGGVVGPSTATTGHQDLLPTRHGRPTVAYERPLKIALRAAGALGRQPAPVVLWEAKARSSFDRRSPRSLLGDR